MCSKKYQVYHDNKAQCFPAKKGHDTCTSKPICDFILLSTPFSFLLKIFQGNGFVSGLLKLHCNKSLSYVNHFLRVTVKGLMAPSYSFFHGLHYFEDHHIFGSVVLKDGQD